jgi:DNA polymerase-3 subunit delta'
MDAEELIARVNDLQPRLIAQLQKASASQQLAHAFLFTGPAGRGQTLVADWLAMRLMCPNIDEDGQPDGTCHQCQRITNHEHPDVIEIKPDGKSIKVDQVRFLKEEFTKTAVEGQQKIFIINGADTMTSSAANGLLKFIEEPAPGQTAILIAENKAQLLPTIVSRTQVVQSLTDSAQVAKNWLTDDWFTQVSEAVLTLAIAMLENSNQAFTQVQTTFLALAGEQADKQTILMMFAQVWRDILLTKSGIQTNHFAKDWTQLVKRYDEPTLLAVVNIVLAAPQKLQKNISFQTTLEATILESQFKLAGLT